MTDIRFYHLTTQTIDQALPAILAKALSGGHRVLVKLADETQVDQINDVLWTYRADSFLPHGTAKEGYGDQQPIWITAGDDHPNQANVLVMGARVFEDNVSAFDMVCAFLPGHDDENIQHARQRWKDYTASGHQITYWQQTDTGGWQKKS